jgi:glycosyltransferase involved in cell wall biosynthesis
LENLVRIARLESQVLERITPDLFDVALIYPCRFTQAPALLGRISVPSLYYAPEPRRRSFESSYHTALPRSRSATKLREFAGAFLVERWLRHRDRRAFLSASNVACNSRHTAARLLESYGRGVEVCYPGVDTDVFTPRSELDQLPRSVVSVGALDPSKGHDLVIEALATLDAQIRPRLIIVHERSALGYEAILANRAVTLGVELEFRRGISDPALADTYSSATATFAAARREPFGLTPLESLACGTPVVAIREGGFCETVDDGVNGYLTDPTPGALAAALLDVIYGGLAARSPRAIRDTVVNRWTWDASAHCVNAILLRLAGLGSAL